MKRRNRHAEIEPIARNQRRALALALTLVVLTALVAASVLLRPILAAQLQGLSTGPTDGSRPSETASTAATTESAAAIVSRPAGDLDSLPATAYARGRTITVGVSDAFGSINPLYGGGDADQDAIALVFEPLLRINAAGQPEPVLLESSQLDLAARTLTIRLRNDHIWRDGRAVSAEDVAFTYRCLIAPTYDGPLAGRFDEIAGVAVGQAADGRQTVVLTLQEGVTAVDDRLLTVGILKSDYYAVPADRVYELGRKKLPPEGSGAYQWLETSGNRRALGLRPGYAGSIQRIEQVLVGSDDKYPMLLAGELDLVRHDWNERIRSRIERLPAYACFDTFRIDQYLLTAPDAAANGLPTDPSAIEALIAAATGTNSQSRADTQPAASPLTLAFFAGIEETVTRQMTATAERIQRRLEQVGQPVTLQPLSWPELADRATLGTYQLLLLPAATDNRLPRRTVLMQNGSSRSPNAAIAFQHPQVILVSARLDGIQVNPNGALFAASPLTFADDIAGVRILNADGTPLED